jgi:GNAT superfamily N-acetyltransferase
MTPPALNSPALNPDLLIQTMEATWPPASTRRIGPWLLRDGAGGGKRVSATTAEGRWTVAELDAILPQSPLFMIRPQDSALDAALAARGFARIDAVVGYAAPVASFAPPPRMTGFAHWPPLQITRDLWAEGGIGPSRVAVMDRVSSGAKAALMARTNDRATGAAFVALHGQVAMLHALEVSPAHRRHGSARNILCAAALWAQYHGAETLALVVTEANAPARALYASQGMQLVGQYHYRQI